MFAWILKTNPENLASAVTANSPDAVILYTALFGGAADAAVAAEDVVRFLQVIDEEHHPAPGQAEVIADARSLPVDQARRPHLGVEAALAVAEAGQERAAALCSENIAVGLAVGVEGVADDACQFGGEATKEAATGLADLLG